MSVHHNRKNSFSRTLDFVLEFLGVTNFLLNVRCLGSSNKSFF